MTTLWTMTPGAQANLSGNMLERFVEHTLIERGYLRVEVVAPKPRPAREWMFKNRLNIKGKYYARQVVCGKTIYGLLRRCDFFIVNPERFSQGLILECKWQQVSGSVDEKFPYLVHCIALTQVPSVVLIDGGKYKKEALSWLKAQVGLCEPLIGVYTMAEFQTLVNKGFLG